MAMDRRFPRRDDSYCTLRRIFLVAHSRYRRLSTMVFESFPKKLSIAVVHLYMIRPPFSWIHNNFVVGRSRKIHKEGKTMNTNTNNQNDQGYPEIADELMELVNSLPVERLEFD